MFFVRAWVANTPRRVFQLLARNLSGSAGLQKDHGGSVRVLCESNVAVITIDRGENRMNPDFMDQINSALDEALRNPDLKGIVTTGEGAKFYSNGLDLLWLMEQYKSNPDNVVRFLKHWQSTLIRMVTCPVVTVAAINGHAYAGGAILSLCHDFRVMQAERGWWCLNEANLGIEFPEWILKVFSLKLGGNGARALFESTLYAKRFTAEEAKQRGIVDETCTRAELLPKALALVNNLVPGEVPGRDYVRSTKQGIFKEALSASSENYDFSKFSSYFNSN
jgi:enoyl-CoA hydratase/carnithine racemase